MFGAGRRDDPAALAFWSLAEADAQGVGEVEAHRPAAGIAVPELDVPGAARDDLTAGLGRIGHIQRLDDLAARTRVDDAQTKEPDAAAATEQRIPSPSGTLAAAGP